MRTPARTASTSCGSTARPSSSGTRAPKRSTGPRIARRPALGREVIETESVGEQAGEPPLEGVEAREGVLPDADEDVDGQLRSRHELRERIAERRVGAVVDEVLLDLVEEQVDLAVQRGGDLDRLRQRAGLDSGGGGDGGRRGRARGCPSRRRR